VLQKRSGRCGEEKSLPLQKTEPPAHSLITILIETAAAAVVVVVKVAAIVNLVVEVVVVTVITENTDAIFL